MSTIIAFRAGSSKVLSRQNSRIGGPSPLTQGGLTTTPPPGEGASGSDAWNSRDRDDVKRRRRPPTASIRIDSLMSRNARGRQC